MTKHFSQHPSFALPAVMLLATWREVISKVWYFLNYPYTIGNLKGSVTSLIGGAVILAVALLLSRTLSKILQKRIAKRAFLDPGIQYTIARLAQYVVVTLGVLLALAFGVGLDLTSIAVIFTALSVGIGFGLQYIAADIASGFILLFEAAGSRRRSHQHRQGRRRRAEHQPPHDRDDHQRSRLGNSFPNSQLVREQLINWSYGDPRARMSIHVGVAYGSDINLVTETLLKATEEVDSVLRDPPPKSAISEIW
jgi:small-conductance mechanosensitive channel